MPRGMARPVRCRSAAKTVRYMVTGKPKRAPNSPSSKTRPQGKPIRPGSLTASNLGTTSPTQAIRFLTDCAARRPDIKDPFLHYSLNYEDDDPRTHAEMLQHLQRFLIHIQLDSHPWVAAIHDPNHIHVFASRVGPIRGKLFNPSNSAKFLDLAISKTDPIRAKRLTPKKSIHHHPEPIAAREAARRINDVSYFRFISKVCTEKLITSTSAREFIERICDAGISIKAIQHKNATRGIIFNIKNYYWGGSSIARELSLPRIAQRFETSTEQIERIICDSRENRATIALNYSEFATIRLRPETIDDHQCEEPDTDIPPIKLSDVLSLIIDPPEYRITWQLMPDGTWLCVTEFGTISIRQFRISMIAKDANGWPPTDREYNQTLEMANHIGRRLGWTYDDLPEMHPELQIRLNPPRNERKEPPSMRDLSGVTAPPASTTLKTATGTASRFPPLTGQTPFVSGDSSMTAPATVSTLSDRIAETLETTFANGNNLTRNNTRNAPQLVNATLPADTALSRRPVGDVSGTSSPDSDIRPDGPSIGSDDSPQRRASDANPPPPNKRLRRPRP